MAIYWVETGHGGTDSGTETNPYLTIDQAMNAANTAGDHVWVKASGTYDENGNIDTAGSATSFITYEGYTSSTGDNGKVTWTNSGGSALTDTPATSYCSFKNFKFDNCSATNVVVGNALVFINCEFTSSGGDGVICAFNCSFYKCIVANSTTIGINAGTGSGVIVAGCKIYSNGGIAFSVSSRDCIFYNTVFYAGHGSSDVIAAQADNSVMMGCTIDGDGTSGRLVDAGTEAWACIIDSVLYDGADAYYTTDVALQQTSGIFANNLINSCTNSYWDGSAEISHPGYNLGDVTSAPGFTDEAGDDYTLGDSSPAIDAGLQPGGIT